MVQVHHDEGVANRIDPESCAAAREGISEALTGERIGQPLSRESCLISGADVVPLTESNTDGRDIASAQTARRGRRHWHVRKFLAREPGDPTSDHRHVADLVRIGKVQIKPKPMMHGHGESDPAIVAAKPTNKAERSAAEPVERRAGPRGMRASKARAGLRAGKPCHRRWSAYGTLREYSEAPLHTRGGSRMPELGPYGSVRGARSNARPYRDQRSTLAGDGLSALGPKMG